MSSSTNSRQADSAETSKQLTDVPYIGDSRAEQFVEAGYETPADVANQEPDDVARDVHGIGGTDAKRIVEGAKRMCVDTEPELDDTISDIGVEEHSAEADVEEHQPSPDELDDDEPEIPDPDTFEARLEIREGGEELWYRHPETDSLLIPYDAPGFEQWCEARGHDPEEMRQ